MMNYPVIVFTASVLVLWSAEQVGSRLHRRRKALEEEEHKDLELILAATLTLLSLIIGFTFSMAVNRYDQRKNYEEAEANAIGTEYVRAGSAARVRRVESAWVPDQLCASTRTLLHHP